jgi:hypothetical protein
LGRKNKLTYNDRFVISSYHPAGMDMNLDGRIGKTSADSNDNETPPKTFRTWKEYYLRNDNTLFNPIAFNGVETSNGWSKVLSLRDTTNYDSDEFIEYLIMGKFPEDKKIDPEQSLLPWLKIHPMGYDPIYLPGTISGLTESVTGTWENFKYIGSPYSAYKYNGVERTINFNLNLYWSDTLHLPRIREQIEYIRHLCFPAPDVSVSRYGDSSKKKQDDDKLSDSDQLFYRPQFIELTIHGYNKKIFGFIENINIQVPDDATWPSTNINANFSSSPLPAGLTVNEAAQGLKNSIYPSHLNVEFAFKIVENSSAKINTKNNIVQYKYNLDGLGTDSLEGYPARRAFEWVKEDPTKHDVVPTAKIEKKLNEPTKPENKQKRTNNSNGKKPDKKYSFMNHPDWSEYERTHKSGEAFGNWLEKRKRKRYPWENNSGQMFGNFKGQDFTNSLTD